MAARRRHKPEVQTAPQPDVFDRVHLARYTMDCAALESEIVELFLIQLPSTLAMIRQAESAADWKLATHTLKGSAAAVGARRINRLAVELEPLVLDANVNIISELVGQLDQAVDEFRALVSAIYS